MNIMEDGVEFHHNFLSDSELQSLRQELDFMFTKNLISGPGYSVYLSSFVQEITWPVSKIRSINLMEKAVKVLKHLDTFPALKEKKFKLAHVAVYREKDNKVPLHWHSDGRDGNLIRAQVCIRGGQTDSGAFQYVKQSNHLKGMKYLPQPNYVETHQDQIQTCAEKNGTLYLFNTYGIHNKTKCTSERVSIMFDFLPEDYIAKNVSDVSSNLILSIDNLTPDVLASLDRFQLNRPADCLPSANTIDAYKFNLKWGGYNRRFNVINKIKKIIKSLLLRSREATYP